MTSTSSVARALHEVTLDDKYTLESGKIYLNGIQALVRLPILQRVRDIKAGLNTAGLITGYRGSPLGGVDKEMIGAQKYLLDNHIQFKPAINEDLAATAVWGSQQLNLFPGARYDGVFSMWYGKGPGVDRCGDVFRHGNSAGVASNGGVLLLAGDDPAIKSSTITGQAEFSFMDAMIPVLAPANVQDSLDFGLFGWALSRYASVWTGMKLVSENIESTASVYVDPAHSPIILPNDFEMPEGGLATRWPDSPIPQEARLHEFKMAATEAFVRTNGINKTIINSPNARIGVVTAGKPFLDVMQALEILGIDERKANQMGLNIYKPGMIWPLEKDGMRTFAEGLEEIVVIEEKRPMMETQIKEQAYHWPADRRPRVVGVTDENGAPMRPTSGQMNPVQAAKMIARRLLALSPDADIAARLTSIEEREKSAAPKMPAAVRLPYFCSGCPHNTSTRVPDGSRATLGIGCHFMVAWMNRNTATFTHMGAEGASWIGQAPFTDTKHIFVNLGDGTYFHSGLLAIRAAVSAKVNVTYKILFNDAVAMTGGQAHDGPLNPQMISKQVAAEGATKVVVVTDEPEKYPSNAGFADGVTIHHRDEFDTVQKKMREIEGVTAIIYDQTCAAEKRRRRKRGTYPDPQRRIFINPAVCEGCGDCGVKSNCVSVEPLETEFGRKRAINQSACNKDYSCLKGFCPSMVVVNGGKLRKRVSESNSVQFDAKEALPEPTLPKLDAPFNLLITGIGGTGVVTVGALLGMAGHLEGKGASVLDITGAAQKNGSVLSHVRIAKNPEDIHAVTLSLGAAHAIIGCDMVTAGGPEALSKMAPGKTKAIINAHQTMTADFTANPNLTYPDQALRSAISDACGGQAEYFDAIELATALLGDSIGANLFMVGYAWQKGLLPLQWASIERAIELNGVAVDFNKQAFEWGRRAAVDLDAVRALAFPHGAPELDVKTQTLDDTIATRVAYLTDYQNSDYARRYKTFVDIARGVETNKAKGMSGLAEATADGYFRLLAYKDEYEMARLHSHPDFKQQLDDTFEGDYTVSYHLSPPLMSKIDPHSGEPKKSEYGAWMGKVLGVVAKLKGLRGTGLDIFRNIEERKMERRLIAEYETLMETVLSKLDVDHHAMAIEMASLPTKMVGFGPIKTKNIAAAKAREAELLTAYLADGEKPQAAE